MPWFPEHDRIHLILILVWVPLQMLALQYIRGGGSESASIPEEPQEIVELHERDHVFFGASQAVRKTHAPKVRFQIGDVVQHRKLGCLGVVVGWDEVARAPALWMAMRYPDLQQEIRIREQPNFRVLLDSRATLYELNPIYVAQEDLNAASSTGKAGGKKPRSSDDDTLPIKHSLLPEYFDYFESDKFIPRPWLRRIYPRG
ncbi:unnamed protein product [Dibothriocephalus latus]|uniref:Hemimethylated DNA-binding domain-containing protein n=1 Tax=Dibothriocephalus latus TaxID=60516 RepID=A0A3P7RI10_DIBLA|nr:unnamed protein product [Dibothriocephalus latus]